MKLLVMMFVIKIIAQINWFDLFYLILLHTRIQVNGNLLYMVERDRTTLLLVVSKKPVDGMLPYKRSLTTNRLSKLRTKNSSSKSWYEKWFITAKLYSCKAVFDTSLIIESSQSFIFICSLKNIYIVSFFICEKKIYDDWLIDWLINYYIWLLAQSSIIVLFGKFQMLK